MRFAGLLAELCEKETVTVRVEGFVVTVKSVVQKCVVSRSNCCVCVCVCNGCVYTHACMCDEPADPCCLGLAAVLVTDVSRCVCQ